MVLIISLIASVFFAFMFMTVIEKVQDALNPTLGASSWASDNHYTAFYWAATLVTNIWTYIIAFVLFILAYWAYIYSQRRSAGYA